MDYNNIVSATMTVLDCFLKRFLVSESLKDLFHIFKAPFNESNSLLLLLIMLWFAKMDVSHWLIAILVCIIVTGFPASVFCE